MNKNLSIVASITSELKSTVLAEMNNMTTEIKSCVTAIESSQQFLSSKFEEIMHEFCKLKVENVRLKQELEILKKSQDTFKSNVNKLEMYVDSAHKEKNLNNMVFLGLPQIPNENVVELVIQTSKAIGVELESEAIVSAVRIGSPNKANIIPPVKVVFKQQSVKKRLLEKKRELGILSSTDINNNLTFNRRPTKITVREELTPLSLQLLRDLRAQQKLLDIKYVWVGRDGSILVKKSEESRSETIKNYDQLKHFILQHQNPIVATRAKQSIGAN